MGDTAEVLERVALLLEGVGGGGAGTHLGTRKGREGGSVLLYRVGRVVIEREGKREEWDLNPHWLGGSGIVMMEAETRCHSVKGV